MRDIKVHIFSLKREICSLVKKTLKDKGYIVTCNGDEELTGSLVDNFTCRVDCLIIDKDINDELRKKIKEKFKDVFIICLPSLKSEALAGSNVTYMSEPLRLSELRAVLEKLEAKILSEDNE